MAHYCVYHRLTEQESVVEVVFTLQDLEVLSPQNDLHFKKTSHANDFELINMRTREFVTKILYNHLFKQLM